MKIKAVSGIMLTLLMLSMVTLVFNIQPVRASGTIYIQADGSVDPPTANITTVDNATYTFTDNIHDSIVVERDNIVVDGVGFTLQGARPPWIGISLYDRSGITIKNIKIEAFPISIYLVRSSNNRIIENTITNTVDSISLFESSDNLIAGNTVEQGISMYKSFHNTISGNVIYSGTAGKDDGIDFVSSSDNTITENTIVNFRFGIWFLESSTNIIYHNNFIDNIHQVLISYLDEPSINVWDDGYPSGGNYWSDYNGTDFCNGPYQNETGYDGIGDTPYFIDDNNEDNYPLMNPWTPTPPTVVATADVVPNTLNLKSEGEWITCYIELPEGHNVSDIDIYSIRLNDTFPVSLLPNPPVPVPTEIGDYDNDTIPDLMVKFNRTALTSHIYHTLGIKYGNVTLKITGNLTDGTPFEGKDTIRVIFGGDADLNGLIEMPDFYVWRENFGKTPEQCQPHMHPDFNNNEIVELLDFYIWRENFGATTPQQP